MQELKRTLEIDAPATDVWRVLTTPELVREWAAAYQDGISIRTSWREGEKVTWKTPDGATRAQGEVAAFKPGKLLKFVYSDAAPGPAADARTFSDTYEISETDQRTRLRFTTGPLDDSELEAIREATELAIREIKSLAEESAQIRRSR